MKKHKSTPVFASQKAPYRLLQSGRKPDLLPVPSGVIRTRLIEEWRDRLWRAKHNYLISIGPMHRELIRKTVFSMHKARLEGMIPHLNMGVFLVWFFTGRITLVQEFIEKVFGGTVFLMDSKIFLPDNLPPDLSKTELIYKMLLYDPHVLEGGITLDKALDAKRFFEFVGAAPQEKPWIAQWMSEIQAVEMKMIEELGEDAANELCATSVQSKTPGSSGVNSRAIGNDIEGKVSYW